MLAKLKSHNYAALGALTNEEALQKFEAEKPGAVLIGGGVDGESRALFHRTFGTTAKVIDARFNGGINIHNLSHLSSLQNITY